MVFDEDGSYIMNKKSGEVTWLREENGVYLLDVQVAPANWKPEQGIPEKVMQDTAESQGKEPPRSSAPFGGPER